MPYSAKGAVIEPEGLELLTNGGRHILDGVPEVETWREAQLCWSVAQFYALAQNASQKLEDVVKIAKSWEHNGAFDGSDEAACLFRKLQQHLDRFQAGFSWTLDETKREFHEEQLAASNTEGEDHGSDSGSGSDSDGVFDEAIEDTDESQNLATADHAPASTVRDTTGSDTKT